MSDKQRQQHVYQTLKQKHLSLGDENTTKEEWLTNVQRDIYNSIQGHSGLLEYTALNQQGLTSSQMLRVSMIKKMAQKAEIRKRIADSTDEERRKIVKK
ncbi:hypothetical protein NCAS_0G02260 [Naumovozyma castellii]|uniref:Splicing factor subunit n=1 Tax=Naumovozyma castellii TaxID=27288 RepID=G0VI78_NAUCA|nr:hypothetical protein NCAS_0G02260 [Naumovozyma castellii CBS 4309]CCC71113.1 hypothetical protein NCAS_0G02260 [Naumovozyma castellii CBS 4309]